VARNLKSADIYGMADKELMRRLTAILFAAVWLGCTYGFIVSTHSTRHFLDVANKAGPAS
jgi:hypothetical protein